MPEASRTVDELSFAIRTTMRNSVGHGLDKQGGGGAAVPMQNACYATHVGWPLFA